MPRHALFELLDLPTDAPLEMVERGFIDHVRSRIQSVLETYDEAVVKKEEEVLYKVHGIYYDYALQWIKSQIEKNKDEKSHPDADIVKKQARSVLASLQNDIIAFSVCYMHIMRFMTLVRDEIKKDDSRGIGFVHRKHIKWTNETGVMLGRNKKRKLEIDALNIQYKNANTLLSSIESPWDDFEKSAYALLSRDDWESVMRGIRAGLRSADFDRANRALKELTTLPAKFSIDRKSTEAGQAALYKKGKTLVDFFATHADELSNEEGKLFLKIPEVKILLDSQALELKKIRAYVVKYNMPYMEYKLESLGRHRDKLLVMGSPEGMIALYHKLIVGMATPMKTREEIRAYDSEVMALIKHLQISQFQETAKIYALACETVDEFRQARIEYNENLDYLMGDPDGSEIINQVAEA